jgi:hypothetical protein
MNVLKYFAVNSILDFEAGPALFAGYDIESGRAPGTIGTAFNPAQKKVIYRGYLLT